MTPVRMSTRIKNNSLLVVAFLVVLAGILLLSSKISPDADALVSGADWQAGRIIDDDIFYNGNTMTVQEIQAFMNEKVPSCDTNGTKMYNSSMTNAQYAASRGWPGPAYVCLKDYYQVPRSDQNINNLSTNVIPNGAISSAQIIKNAATTYNISPKILLVTLEKESLNLLKDSWPLPKQFRNPMGYGCPDTAPCDPQYEGFYNQMMNSARQFKLYKDNSNSYRYKPFQNNTISFQANAPSCGSTSVYVSTYATAGLYNYTPYQPNQAALSNMYGTGDGCSAYGNRNFWRIYNDWFGSPTVPKSSVYIPDNTYTIKNPASGRSIDVAGGGTGNGTRAQIYDTNGTTAQLWQTTRLNNGYYMIKNVGSGRYLDVSNASLANGAAVQIYDNNGGCAQQWAAVSVGPNLAFVNACSGKAIDISGGNFGNSTKLQMYSRNYSHAQQWSLISKGTPELANGYYKVAVSSNLKMSPSTTDASIQISGDLNNSTQTWQFHRQADGTYRIRNQSSNTYIAVNNNGELAGSRIESKSGSLDCSQSWILKSNQGGSYTIQSACYGYVLDVVDGSVNAVGNKIQVWGGNNTDAQKWNLTKVADIGIVAGDYSLSNSSRKFLDIADGRTTNGTRLQIWDGNNTDAQKWQFTLLQGNIFKVSNKASGKVLDVNNGDIINGTSIQIWDSNNTCAQQWQVIDNGNATYSLASACNGSKTLDVTGGNTATNGTKIQLYTLNVSEAQIWSFNPL